MSSIASAGAVRTPVDRNDGSVSFVVPKRHVKTVKTALENKDLLDRRTKIRSVAERAGVTASMSIPTRIAAYTAGVDPCSENLQDLVNVPKLSAILQDLGLEDVMSEIKFFHTRGSHCENHAPRNPLISALAQGLKHLPEELLDTTGVSAKALLEAFPTTYTIYKPLLLLPPNTFASAPWTKIFISHGETAPLLHQTWQALAHSMGVTHIAINAGIPPSTSSTVRSHCAFEGKENVLRAPTNLTPLYGYFGPRPTQTLQYHPVDQDFASAFWVTTTQNGIHQTWAPLYTMFSRGNVKEKSRLVSLPSVTCAAEEACMAADLYAGIGYFVFSYRKSGIKKVLCWELNPWSIEGLRRGAEMNGWTSKIVSEMPQKEEDWATLGRESLNVDFVVFRQSNEEALSTLNKLGWLNPKDGVERRKTQAIRHVNCGFLPSSKLSWRTAVHILDRELGGWIHAHENIGIGNLELRTQKVETKMQEYLNELTCDEQYRPSRVVCEHVEKVKTYAPGVLHVVLDMHVTC